MASSQEDMFEPSHRPTDLARVMKQLGLATGQRYRFDLSNGYKRWGKLVELVVDSEMQPVVLHLLVYNETTNADVDPYSLRWDSVVGFKAADAEPFTNGQGNDDAANRRLPKAAKGPMR